MSDPNPRKTQQELEQVDRFLRGQGLRFEAIERGSDPPDVRVLRPGLAPVGIEVTAYHPQHDRVGLEKRAAAFRALLDGLIRQSAKLKGVSVVTIFHDLRMPRENRHSEIAEEMIRCLEHATDQGWIIERTRKISFADNYHDLGGEWFVLPSTDWPTIAETVNVLQMSRFAWDGYLPSNNYHAQAAFSSPYPEAFLAILTKKDTAVHDAIRKGTYMLRNERLWLLILCNLDGDLASNIYGDPLLRESIERCGFDFEGSSFDEVWLMDVRGDGRSQRLHPGGS